MRLTLDRTSSPPRVVVAVGKERKGRGAYLCKRRVCLDRALQRKAFQRAFREQVSVAVEEIAEAVSAADS